MILRDGATQATEKNVNLGKLSASYNTCNPPTRFGESPRGTYTQWQGARGLSYTTTTRLKMAEDDNQNDQDSGVALQEARPKTKKPPLYKVVMLNDDYTPMEFVVHVLEQFFSVDRPTATRIMLEVHTRGKGVCGLFTHEIAETKVSQVNQYARENQHPLLCTLELA